MDPLIHIPEPTRRFFFFGLLGGIASAMAPKLWPDGPEIGRDYRSIPELLEGFSSYQISDNSLDSENNKAPRLFVATLRDLDNDSYTLVHRDGSVPVLNSCAEQSRSARRLITLLREDAKKTHVATLGPDYFYSESWDREWIIACDRANHVMDQLELDHNISRLIR